MKKKIKVWIAVAVVAVIIVACSVARFGKKGSPGCGSHPGGDRHEAGNPDD